MYVNDNLLSRRDILCLIGGASILTTGIGCGGGGSKTVKTTVSGIVRDAADNDIEVEGATVTIGGKSAVTYTRENANASRPVGTFVITDAVLGAFTAIVTRPNKPAQTIAFQPAIKAGANLDLVLTINIGQLGGRVLAPNGAPAADAFVSLSTNIGSVSTTTDSSGRFLLENVIEGTAELTASLGPASVIKAIAVVTAFLDIGDLTLIDNGNTTPPSTTTTIVGTVTDAVTNAKLVGVNVVLFKNDFQVETTTTDASGKFGFVRPIGTYTIQVLAQGYLDGASDPFALTSENTPPRLPKIINIAMTPRT